MSGCGKPCNCPSYRDHLASISMQPAGRHPIDIQEDRLRADLDAYKRLRKNGLQPKNTDGCAELEKHATTQQEIEWMGIIPKDKMAEAREGIEIAREIEEAAQEQGLMA